MRTLIQNANLCQIEKYQAEAWAAMKLGYLIFTSCIAIGIFFFGRWWEATEYLPPPRDEAVIRAFGPATLDAIAKRDSSGQTRAIYEKSRIITQKIAGISCLTMLPRQEDSEFVVDACFSDKDGKLIKLDSH